MKILITGCAGLLGSHYSRHLLELGHEVIGIDDLSGGYEDFLPKSDRFYFSKMNLENRNLLSSVFKNYKPNVCFHFAAYAAEGLSPFIRNFNYTNNLVCSTNVVNECISNEIKIIFTSSIAVYGEQAVPFFEDNEPKPIDPYGISKYAVEMDLKQAGEQFGLEYTIVRPHNIIGIYQNIWDRYRNVIGIFIRSILKKEPILIYGDGEQTRGFSDIRFCMGPFDKFLNGYNKETFNLGSDTQYSLNDLANIIKSIAKERGYETEIIHAEPRHEVKHAICNHDKAKRVLGFLDETDIEKLIREIFVWAENQPERKVKTIPYEITKNMYNYWK